MFNLISKKIRYKSIRNIHYLKTTTNSKKILTPSCLNFIEKLTKNNIKSYDDCLQLRDQNNAKKNYSFRNDTKNIRDSEWVANEIPSNLSKRHVEITGPGNNARMVINAFNSGADGYMLDLEDSMTPSWFNIIDAHNNIKKAVRKELTDVKYDNNGNIIKEYSIGDTQPTFFVRSRGLHMLEEHVIVNNRPVPATFFDIGTFLYHNAKYLHKNSLGPYLYMPKLESYEEAQLVNQLIVDSQKMLSLPNGTVKVTCLIETLPSIFQTEEIIYALKDHIAALNCGRWDYLFSMIKSLGNDKILPYRDELTMDKPFLEAYVKQIVQTCHKRGINAIGGMSAFIPTNNPDKNKIILQKIIKDKELEIERGCDGAWVAHPGLVKPIKDLFENKLGRDNQIGMIPEGEVTEDMILDVTKVRDTIKLNDVNKNINIALQYISAWLDGNGAVALNNLMEDLATSEISVFQLKQWVSNKQNLNTIESSNLELDENIFIELLEKEYLKMVKSNQVEYAFRHYETAKDILREYVLEENNFLPDVATKYLNIDNGFKGAKWSEAEINKLSGSKGYLTGIELTKHRGEYLNKYLYEENNTSYKFLGTSNGVSAVNVVSGGNGAVGPYAGGWQHNAMGNRLDMCLPDTLHVAPEESANCAREINLHLHRADSVQHIQKLDNPNMNTNNYYDMAFLCDLEQGWCTPEKTRIATLLAIQNGINVIHIEDQGEKKRCGHLGDKELNTYEDYAIIMRSANLAAQELLGPEQADKQWVRFVARTDALSAKRIHNSSKLQDKENDEHKFIDWDRGTSPDGKYLYLKQGVNPETGNSWGLDLSIERSTKIVDEGLASHVWMETPDADLNVAKIFLNSVNKNLLPKGKKAYGLYNHSPSFDWDVKFFKEAEPFAQKLACHVQNEIFKSANSLVDDFLQMNTLISSSYRSGLEELVRDYLKDEGSIVQGDHLFTDKNIYNITLHCLDYTKGETNWINKLDNLNLDDDDNYNVSYVRKYIDQTLERGFDPVNHITEIIVDQRLSNFSKMLSSFGFNMHLITLPEFHITAFNMHKLSSDFSVNGINAFVKNTQRPERILSENNDSYTYYKHQTATGTGVEAEFNKAVGSHDVNILDDSTEQDDIKKRID